jgi:hypothetical protein
MRLQRVRFVGLTRAQVRLVARVGGAGPRPPMAEAAVGDYAIMQGAFVHPAGSAFAAERTLHFLERNQIAERVSGFLLMEHQTGPPLKG